MPSPFDAKAATWDEEPRRRALAQAIVAAIAAQVPLRPGLRLLDVGCGTGLVGLPLASATGSLLGVDLSLAMVARFQAKAQQAGLAGVRGELRDLAASPLPAGSIDLALSAMAFHHIAELDPLLRSLAGCLAPGGRLAVADLEAEDGSFHDEPVPHRGFDPEALLDRMRQAGLEPLGQQRVHVLEKPSGRGYPVFLALAGKG